uniref:Putative secreted protein n=1 Tax=Anopheles marajoara TaxID=58244 RepID=A0A2M4CDQ2_9DIPT
MTHRVVLVPVVCVCRTLALSLCKHTGYMGFARSRKIRSALQERSIIMTMQHTVSRLVFFLVFHFNFHDLLPLI